jgi:syntaxin 8
LSQILARQKNVGLTIGDEVDTQNEILDGINDGVDITRTRLIRETRNVERVDRKDRTFWLWIIMVVLLIAIVIVALVPYNGKA